MIRATSRNTSLRSSRHRNAVVISPDLMAIPFLNESTSAGEVSCERKIAHCNAIFSGVRLCMKCVYEVVSGL